MYNAELLYLIFSGICPYSLRLFSSKCTTMAADILFVRVTRVVLAYEVVGRLGRMASSVSYKCCVKFVKVVVRVAVEHKKYKL